MSRLAELGVAKRLSLIVASGVLALLALGLVASIGQDELVRQATVVRDLETAIAAVNHLDTRESELKVDMYRSLLGQDVSGDVADDVASASEAADAVGATGLPSGPAAAFAALRPDV